MGYLHSQPGGTPRILDECQEYMCLFKFKQKVFKWNRISLGIIKALILENMKFKCKKM